MSDSKYRSTEGDHTRDLDAEQLGEPGSEVFRQRIQLTGRSLSEIAQVTNATPASDAYGIVVRVVGGSSGSGTADQGEPNTVDNAWPILVTDGIDIVSIVDDGGIKRLAVQAQLEVDNIEIGTVDQGTPAAVADAWPIVVTDGVDTVDIIDDGGIKRLAVQAQLEVDSIEIGTVDQGTPTTLLNAWPVKIVGGASVIGTSSDPVRIDPTGTTTQPVSLESPASASGTIGSALDTVTFSILGSSGIMLEVSGTFTATLTVKGTGSGAQYADTMDVYLVQTMGRLTGITDPGVYFIPTAGLTEVTVYAFDYTSGSADIYARESKFTGIVETVTRSLPLPDGAAEEATLQDIGTILTGVATEATAQDILTAIGDLTTPTDTQPVSGTVDIGNTPLPVKQTCSSAVVTSVSASTESVTLLALNVNRRSFIIYNDSSLATIRVKFGSTASSASFTIPILPGALYIDHQGYTGVVDGIWSVADGAARITELLS